MLWKLDGLSEYDIRRPMTSTGTNILGLIKHLSTTEARYFGEIFRRPFPEPLPPLGDSANMWATEHETRAEIVDRYRRAWGHADATLNALDIDAPGHVPWWPRPDVKLFNVLVRAHRDQPARRSRRHSARTARWRDRSDGRVLEPPEARRGLLGEAVRGDRAATRAAEAIKP